MALFIVPTLAACLLTAVLFGGTTIGNAESPLEAPYLHLNDVILFQGDSVTDGGRWRTGSDFNHIMGQDYGYIIAAEIGAVTRRATLRS